MKNKIIYAGMLLIISIGILAACGKSRVENDSKKDDIAAAPTNDMPGETIEKPLDSTDYSTPNNYTIRQNGRKYGDVVQIQYYSSTVDRIKEARVALPYGYSKDKQYPVIYLLHGLNGNNTNWIDMGAGEIVQNLHYDNNIAEMIVVSADVFTHEQGASESDYDFATIVKGYDNFEYDLVNDLMPYIEANYSVKTGRDNTAIAGFSLGGRGALYIGFKYPELFAHIGAFSSASGVIPRDSTSSVLTTLLSGFKVDNEVGEFKTILLNVGVSDEVCKDASYVYDKELTRQGIPHVFYDMGGGHEGAVWQNGLYNFAKRIFR